jgi:CheY-like chemotaxis protein
MPEMNGLEAMALIRENPQTAHIPMIALTAFAMAGDRARCLAAGANEYLSKPVELAHLTKVIRGFFE